MRRWAWLPVPVLLLALASACGESRPFDACQVNPTFQNEQGEWREADGEPLDDDPCDSDDYDKHGKLKPGKVRKPAVKPPAKLPNRPPAGPGVPAPAPPRNNRGR